MNQAQRHLWARAYMLPAPTSDYGLTDSGSLLTVLSKTGHESTIEATGKLDSSVVEKGPRLTDSLRHTVGHANPSREPAMGATSLGSSKPRILIARPKPVNRNDKIRLSLERAYPRDAKQILDQAYAAYYYQKPASSNLPELYELLESGFLDMGIEACGLHSWVIGRSK